MKHALVWPSLVFSSSRLLVFLAALASAAPAQPARPTHSYTIDTVVTGFSNPWAVAFLPNGDMLVTERRGTLRVVRNGRLVPQPVAGVPRVAAVGQGGLMDVALHPNFAANQLVYLSYSKPGLRGATTAVIRARFDGRALQDVENIFVARAWAYSVIHFGSRLAFDRRGFLHITVGERGSKSAAQSLSNHHGKHIRLHDDGRVPTDNPFVARRGARPEIFAYGNRNPQGLTVHPVTGDMWSVEHGPRGGDELNLIKAGLNYGWPTITYGIDYDGTIISELTTKPGMEQPVFYFVPSIATSGLAIYHGDAFPNWRGDAFIGGLTGGHVARITIGSPPPYQYERIAAVRQRVRDVRVGPGGLLYLLIDGANAPLLRLRPSP